MKLALVFANSACVYYSIYAYAEYFGVTKSRVTDKKDVVQVLRVLLAGHAEKDVAFEAEQAAIILPGSYVVHLVVQSEMQQEDIAIAAGKEKPGEVAPAWEMETVQPARATKNVERKRLDDIYRISHIISRHS
ncbi:hypothetical protein WAI453_012591 [Rhynchosporium graminicola]